MSYLENLLIMISVLLTGGFFTLLERKIMGSVQFREGPNKVMLMGFLQPLGDALKLFSKTSVSSEVSIDLIYFFSPLISFFISLLSWVVYPVVWGIMSWYSGIFFVMFCFSVSVYGVILSGWFSRSKYASLGCIRALSQSVSYEIPLSISLLMFMLIFSCSDLESLGSYQELVYFVFPFFFLFFAMVIIFSSEVNRAPFDLAEGESELVSGFSVEFGGSVFVMVFLSEYVSLVWVSFLSSLLFFGCLGLFIGLKVVMLMILFVWLRVSFPRIRFDLVMSMCWLVLLPLVISLVMLSICAIFSQGQKEACYC